VKSRNYGAKWPVRLIYQCLTIDIVEPFCNNRVNFGERIKIIKGSLSQEDFGYLFGVHRTTVHVWVCNEIMPGEGIIKAFFMLFNANLNWLFSGKGEPYFTDLAQSNED
jgi:hypothetical protein